MSQRSPALNHFRLQLIVTGALAIFALGLPASADSMSGEELRPMLKISWREGPEYPMGIQDSAFGVVDGKVISAGGFTRYPKDAVNLYPHAFGGAPSGFTNLTLMLDPSNDRAGWRRIADIPGPARQGAAVAVVGDSLHATGGINYTQPLTYRDVYRLRNVSGEWAWEKLPCDLPWPIYGAGTAVVGNRIYLVGGGDYYAAAGQKDADFHTETGRNGDPVGRGLLVLDTKDVGAGWKRLANLPGTARMTCGCGVVGKRIYVLGGTFAAMKPSPDAYYNVVDSWVYDTEKDNWSRLKDMPHGANRSAVVYKNRYVILIGGYKYGRTWNADGSQTEVYTPEEKKLEFKDFFLKTVLVYDTKTGSLGNADPLLDQTSLPMVGILGVTVLSLGGEGGSRLWHPDTFQIGKLREVE